MSHSRGHRSGTPREGGAERLNGGGGGLLPGASAAEMATWRLGVEPMGKIWEKRW